jgi:cytochrome c
MKTVSHASIPIFTTMAAVSALFVTSSIASAAGDPAAGEQVFARCAPCHATERGETKIGPSLAGVFGRKSGSEPGYSYSAALKAANITWDANTLDQFLTKPAATVPGTKMMVSIRDKTDRQNVIAYLQTLK